MSGPSASSTTSHGTAAKYGGTESVTLTAITVWPDNPSCVRAVTLSRYEPTSDAFGESRIRAVVVPFAWYHCVRFANARSV